MVLPWLGGEPVHIIPNFFCYSVAIDKKIDITDTAQLAIFIRGVNQYFSVSKETVALLPIKGNTTGFFINEALISTLNRFGLNWKYIFRC